MVTWSSIYKPETCEAIVGHSDQVYIHYRATREDGTKFGTLVDNLSPFGPTSLSGTGTTVPALDAALPGMYLGERRMVSVPPRLGWRSGHFDTIMVELMVVRINDMEWKRINDEL